VQARKSQRRSNKAQFPVSENTTRKILTLKANPAIKTHTQIAEILGLTKETVSRHLTKAKPAIDEVQALVKEYDRQFKENLTIEHRAKRYKELVMQDDQLMVSLKALERVDWLQGIRDLGHPEAFQPAHQPFFYLPGGASITLNLGRARKKKQQLQPQDVVVSEQSDMTEDPQPQQVLSDELHPKS